MREDIIDLKYNLNDFDELIEEIVSLEKTLKEKMIPVVKDEVTWSRLKYIDDSCHHNEIIEFAAYHFKLKDILKELYRVDENRVDKIVSLKYDIEKAYADLLCGVVTSINYD